MKNPPTSGSENAGDCTVIAPSHATSVRIFCIRHNNNKGNNKTLFQYIVSLKENRSSDVQKKQMEPSQCG